MSPPGVTAGPWFRVDAGATSTALRPAGPGSGIATAGGADTVPPVTTDKRHSQGTARPSRRRPRLITGGFWNQSAPFYRALVALRAQVAVERGVKYLLVDASDDSSPSLQRLGMHQVATTTPWSGPPATDPGHPT